MLTATELAAMQAVQAQVLPGTAIITRLTTVKDGAGLSAETWPAVGTVACRAVPQATRARSETVAGEQILAISRWDLTFPTGTDVRVIDRVGTGGRMFEVERVNTAESWQTAVRAEAVLFNAEAARE